MENRQSTRAIHSFFLLSHIRRKCIISIGKHGLAAGIAMLLLACGSQPSKKHPSRTYFEQLCQRDAGAKVFRRIENVEGIMLLKLRPRSGDAEWSDKNFQGAALALESRGDGYIQTFLAFEHSFARRTPVSPQARGYITPDIHDDNISNVRGYGYVEAIDPADGLRYRYTLSRRPLPGSKIGSTEAVLVKERAEGEAPRYGVTFEYSSTPQAREMGIASVKIKALDTVTGEVLGEYIQYVKGAGFSRSDAQMNSPWLNADRCPGRTGGTHTLIRQFVDTVLIPTQGEK